MFLPLVLLFGFQQLVFLSNAYDNGVLSGQFDWVNHHQMYSDFKQGLAVDYPSWIYFFYPFNLKFVFIHVFVLIPLLLWLVSRKIGVNVWLVLFFYLLFQLAFTTINFGFLKQVVFNELLLVFLFFFLVLKNDFLLLVGLLFGVIVNGFNRSVSYFNLLFIESFNNFGNYFQTLHQLPGFWGFVVLPFVFWFGWKKKLFSNGLIGFGVVFYFLGFFEWRVFLSLLLLFLPYAGFLVQGWLSRCYKTLYT